MRYRGELGDPRYLERLEDPVTQSRRFKNFGSSQNFLNPTLRPDLRPNSNDSLCHVIESCKIFGSIKELGPKKIKPTLVGFSGE